ncbi:DUF6339 family protein [Nocardia salmonicida]|uniref:DUF6339 family protein n=1 Tax=Nocardia salmonicida TaxID=53431 RepID=UPI0033DC6E9E
MTLLYPRLLRHRAKPLAAEYKDLGPIELETRWSLAESSAVFVATGGTRVDPAKLQLLRDRVVDLAKESGFPQPPDAKQKTSFDLQLAVTLHHEMRISPAEAASGDVWAFLALVVLPDVAHWRYPKPPGDRVLGSDLTRHVLGRMWWRAQLVYAPADADPYTALHVLGEAAFDQIYARRASLGSSPALIQSILRVWNSMDLKGLSERDVLREFLKRLLRLASFVVFESIEDQALDEELTVIALETVRGILPAETSDEEIRRIVRTTSPRTRAVPASASTSLIGSGTSRASSHTLAAQSSEAADRRKFLPYKEFTGTLHIDLRDEDTRRVAAAIVAIVEVEGPVAVRRVHRLISARPGGRVSENMRTTMGVATRQAISGGLVAVEGRVGTYDFDAATLRMDDQPIVLVRERGDRQIDEIPHREIAKAYYMVKAIMPNLGLDDGIRELSIMYGQDRCSRLFYQTVRDCIDRFPE